MYYTHYYRADSRLIADLEQAINGEYRAIACYDQLAGMAENIEERNQIKEIKQDEMKHFQIFSGLYKSLTGRQPNPQITEACPSAYVAGLISSFKDEQETTDFYLGVSDRANDPNIREIFRRVAADEQNHAVWFLYFLTKHQGK